MQTFYLGCLKKIWADKQGNIFATYEDVVEETQAYRKRKETG